MKKIFKKKLKSNFFNCVTEKHILQFNMKKLIVDKCLTCGKEIK